MRGIVSVSVTFLAACATLAASPDKSTVHSHVLPNLTGIWESARWGTVTLTRSAGGDAWVGTYSNTHSGKLGHVSLRYAPSSGNIEGTWSDGTNRFGRVTLRVADHKTIDGAYSADAKCEIQPGSPKAEEFQWKRSAR